MTNSEKSQVDSAAFIKTADRGSVVYAAASIITVVITAVLTSGIAFGEKGVIGGDFLAFYTAGEFALQGNSLAAYDFAAFDARLREHSQLEVLGMMWQYPPTMFFIAAPFALLPYKLSYFSWMLVSWTGLALALRHLGFRGAPLRLLVLSPLCVSVLSHGQISHLTAGLLFLAAYKPEKHWIGAGIAAGLLTIKPQLGLLLPIAFVAVGAWRTIGVASATAILFHLPSLLVFGREGWRDFLNAAMRLNADITGAAMLTPPKGMTTVFGQLKLIGVSGETAVAIQYGVTALLALLTFYVWRRPVEPLAKAAFLGAAAILAAPYAYGYEMTALLLAAAWLGGKAVSPKTPLGLYLIGVWALAAMRPFLAEMPFINIAFLISVSALAVTYFMIQQYSRPVEQAPLRP